jgi:hypothetical protein
MASPSKDRRLSIGHCLPKHKSCDRLGEGATARGQCSGEDAPHRQLLVRTEREGHEVLHHPGQHHRPAWDLGKGTTGVD